MNNLKPIIEESFIQYSGAVLQNRALVDVRDGLKPSARQIFYSMLSNKLTSDKPHKKTANAVGMAMADFYIHGDSSCEGIIMRAAQPFAMRYPLVDAKGNYGSLMESGNYAAMRYTESRLSKISSLLFADIDKKTIDEWRDNYDDTKQYPSVLPTKGFYNICNGTMGIGIGMASSIPQYNLREMNKSLEYLLLNPDCDFEEICIMPDFATGGVLLNEDEVKDSMKKGSGFACKIRSVVEYDKKEKCFIVKEIPYSVYTNTICGELENIINGEDNPGVDRFNDLTGKEPLIKIYLSKRANPDKVLRYLYKNTSLQSHYSINFTMLDKGRFPKVFTWKEMLLAHIAHEKEVYRKGYEFDLKKIEDRLHILEALLKIIASIDEVIQLIKSSNSTSEARSRLMKEYELDEVQAKAVLEIKLSRLAHLEVQKLENEKIKLEKEKAQINEILNNEELFNNELVKGWREVADKFGDDRRTKVLNISKNDEELSEAQEILINLSSQNNLYIATTSSLYSQRKGGVGNKFKMSKGEYVIATTKGSSHDTLLLFSNKGNYYNLQLNELPYEEVIPIESLLNILEEEKICEVITLNKDNDKKNIIFLTKNGILKKSLLEVYNTNRKVGVKAIKLDEDDEIKSILFVNDERIGMMTARGQFVICESKSINPIGRIARGVKGISLKENDELVSANIIPNNTKEIITISEDGYSKKTGVKDISVTNRGTKGVKIQTLKDEKDRMVSFKPISEEREVIIVSSNSQIKFNLNEVPILGKGAQGSKTIKLKENSKIIGFSLF